jgi:hypothetical protein
MNARQLAAKFALAGGATDVDRFADVHAMPRPDMPSLGLHLPIHRDSAESHLHCGIDLIDRMTLVRTSDDVGITCRRDGRLRPLTDAVIDVVGPDADTGLPT